MLPVIPRKAHRLSVEQLACFQAVNADVRAVCGNDRRAGDVADLLFFAFADCTIDGWRVAVRAIERLLENAPPTVSQDARRRLDEFVVENADLLVDV